MRDYTFLTLQLYWNIKRTTWIPTYLIFREFSFSAAQHLKWYLYKTQSNGIAIKNPNLHIESRPTPSKQMWNVYALNIVSFVCYITLGIYWSISLCKARIWKLYKYYICFLKKQVIFTSCSHIIDVLVSRENYLSAKVCFGVSSDEKINAFRTNCSLRRVLLQTRLVLML